jgi:hypothetical protein
LVLSEKFKRSEGLLYRREPEGMGIVLNRELGSLDYLNPTAYTIFELCDGNREIKEIVDELSSRFEIMIDKLEVIKDTVKCIRSLEGRRLLKRSPIEK